MLPAIFSLAGPVPTDEEVALFRAANPVGFILFKRNIDSPEQVSILTTMLRDIVGRDCPILVDQEGGRVARMGPPHWPSFRPFAFFGAMFTQDPIAAREELVLETKAIAALLKDVGINVNCSPVVDVRYEDAHDIIGDRAFSTHPDVVADLGHVVCRAYLDHGITPILKHAPGHGRAMSDSHLELPHVDLPLIELDRTDFHPFRVVSAQPYAARVWMMTAHILYPQLDGLNPATLSPYVMEEIIRRRIGFPGVVIGDDMDMKALDSYGDIVTRSRATLAAGCDLVLNCHGRLDDMAALAAALPHLGEEAAKRLAASGFGGYAA